MDPIYPMLARAESDARAQFPDATGVKALWTPASAESDVCVEIWQGDRARVLPWKPSA